MLPFNKHFKYAHIFWANEVKFNLPLLVMIESSFDAREHCFVTNNAELFKKIEQHKNVFYIEKKNLFNAVGDNCDWIISHDYPSFKISITTKIKNKKKIVFRYWGGRRTFVKTESFFKNVLLFFTKIIYKLLFKIKYSFIPIIGIANVVDRIDLKGLFSEKRMMLLPYAIKYQINFNRENTLDKKSTLNIVIGHRSDPTEQHIKYLRLLKKMPDDKVNIFIPLSYGDMEYASQVREYVNNNGFHNVTLLTEMLPFEKYCSFLLNMDIAIIDCLNSLALGNIQLLVTMGKTIYLNSNGVIAKAFELEKVPYFDVKSLEHCGFDQLQTLKIMKDISKELKEKTYDEYIVYWASLFKHLDNKKRHK